MSDPFELTDDPFADNADLTGRTIQPHPDWTSLGLAGAVVILIPRVHWTGVPNPHVEGAERDVYEVTKIVATSRAAIEFPWRDDPADPESERTHTLDPADYPIMWTGIRIPQMRMVGSLRRAAQMGKPMMGIPTMGPTVKDEASGRTVADIAAAMTTYRERVARGLSATAPRAAWQLVNPDPDDLPVIRAAWGELTAKDPTIGHVTYVTRRYQSTSE